MTETNDPLFHVVLDGRKVGPYDRRTIVGMRIRATLSSDHVLIDAGGTQLTVGDLIGRPRPPKADFTPQRTGGYSTVRACYPGSLRSCVGHGIDVPAFQGEIEVRVQPDVLRLAGRHRKGFSWHDDRVKLPLKDIVHARARGTEVDLALRAGEQRLQRVTLELFSPAVAEEFLQWLPNAAAWPEGELPVRGSRGKPGQHLLWMSVAGATLAVGVVLAVVLAQRLY